jgi:hypothetical protein
MRHLIPLTFVCLCALDGPAQGSNIWVDWTTGATQPFMDSSGNLGTVSYAHSFTTVNTASTSSPDGNFPFTNPVKYLAIQQITDAWIEFTFTGVAPDAQSLLTLGNLRPTNRFIVSAFDVNGGSIVLTSWANQGEYRLFPLDTAANMWTPTTGELVGIGQPNENSKNIFLGLTSNVARIRVDYDSVDGGFEFLSIGLAGGEGVPAPATGPLLVVAAAAAPRRRRRSC